MNRVQKACQIMKEEFGWKVYTQKEFPHPVMNDYARAGTRVKRHGVFFQLWWNSRDGGIYIVESLSK
jgi:hypothetical protein